MDRAVEKAVRGDVTSATTMKTCLDTHYATSNSADSDMVFLTLLGAVAVGISGRNATGLSARPDMTVFGGPPDE